ncbi:hypothetical protein SBRCBS47491_004195 [Sporothrix bragantina]|uniref:Tudor domain-containing protein n=1 Tax=Sporothrix bragantina TaxID=671064 RepID=A0ABP0BLF2_9PEZI
MSAQLAQLQEDRAQYQEQLDLVLSSLNDDPGNDELLGLKAELSSALEIIDESMAELKPETGSKSTTARNKKNDSQRQQTAPEAASGAAAPPANDDVAARVVYKVNESILARWVTGDKAFYPARIMSVTGSATQPMYTVKFKSYDTIETLRARDIRPLAPTNSSSTTAATKRKAEGSAEVTESSAAASGSSTPLSPAASTPPPPPPPSGPPSAPSSHFHTQPPPPPPPPSGSSATAAAAVPPPPPPPPASTAIPPPSRFRTIDRFSQGVVSSASPQLYTQPAQLHQQQQQQQRAGVVPNNASSGASSATPLDAEEPPVKKFKKIKATKQLEAGKSKWQEFSSKGKTGKPGTKKDSMFRTPEGIHGRVGFTGSGQAMRKDVTRSRHVYQTNDDAD